jgi:hypothetical protein
MIANCQHIISSEVRGTFEGRRVVTATAFLLLLSTRKGLAVGQVFGCLLLLFGKRQIFALRLSIICLGTIHRFSIRTS